MRIEGRSVSVVLDGREVVRNASVSCRPGEMTALIGPSGSGKTTLLNCLGLLQPVTEGQILIDGEDATHWSELVRRRFWRNHASFILQDYGVIEDESAAFNVAMTLNVFGMKSAGDAYRIGEALLQTGLHGREGERAAHFSGGEKQRLGIARAIYKRANVILADEPTASLDAANRTRITEMFRQLARAGATVIIATHDDRLASLCDQQFSFDA